MKIVQYVVLVFLLLNNHLQAQETEKVLDKEEKAPSRLESFTKLQTVISAVENFYVDDIKLSEIVDKSIAGLLSELDAHSAYMDKKAYKNMQVSMDGKFGGLGIVIGIRDGALTIISPIDDTPAQKAGVQAGDIILKINEKSTIKMTIDEAVSLMRGKPKTSIRLTIVRKDEKKPLEINIVRDIINVKSVSYKTIDKDILYLRIASFDKNVDSLLSEYIKKHKKNTKGILLDLRNNPGGALDQAIKTVDFFVDKGIIVSQKGREENENRSYEASKNNTLTKVPVVVLINAGSASASEIVSGALQDFKRAVIVGQESFGKGSVQTLLPITKDQDEAIKLTIAKYYLPSGRTIQAKGVKPDIVSYPGLVPQDENKFSIKEKDLKKHLEEELEKVNPKKEKKDNKNIENKKVFTNEDIFKDNQLKTGIDILKALMLVQ